MESAEAKVSFNTHVMKVEERFRDVYDGGFGEMAKYHQVSLGWFVWLHGSHELMHVGMVAPPFHKGDKIKVTFERTIDALPSQPPV